MVSGVKKYRSKSLIEYKLPILFKAKITTINHSTLDISLGEK